MIRFLPLIIALVLLFSCKNDGSKKLIPRKELIPLLVDLHVTDAIAVSSTLSDQFGKLDSALLYGTVMDRYGYSKEELFQTLNYYTSKPEKLMEIYDEVFALLSARSEEAKAEYNKYSSQNTRHIWRPEKNRFEIRGDTIKYPVFDNISIDSLGTYIIDLSIKLNKEDESLDPVLQAYYYDPLNDAPENREYFEEIRLHKSKYARELLLIKELTNPKLTRLRIVPVSYKNEDSTFNKDLELYSLRVSQLKPDIDIKLSGERYSP
jgi:hypothetical protein